MDGKKRTYLAIDLKSFYASVECVDRHLDPLTTNLVVADATRTEKTICLAVSPSLKAYKIPGRARLFEAVQRVKEVNAQRLQTAIRQHKAVRGEDGKYHFTSTSFDANALNADPALGLSYIVAPPRMQRYLDVSTQIYKTYLKYVSPADIYPYSIDEVFIDVTGYLPYDEQLAAEKQRTERVPKRILTEEEMSALSDRLMQVTKGMTITVRYFKEDTAHPEVPAVGNYITLTGKANRIDPVFRTLQVGDTVVPFEDLVEISGEGIMEIDQYLGISED